MTNPSIVNMPARTLVGMKMEMSLADNKTGLLWRTFMSRRKEITNVAAPELFSLQAIDTAAYYKNFNPGTVFEKWAAVEVTTTDAIPSDMEVYRVPEGLYAIFIHIGPPEAFMKTFGFIFNTWLPSSEYVLDNRPYFELLGDKYKNGTPDSEEEVWMPIRTK